MRQLVWQAVEFNRQEKSILNFQVFWTEKIRKKDVLADVFLLLWGPDEIKLQFLSFFSIIKSVVSNNVLVFKNYIHDF